MIHQPSGGARGQATDIQIQAQEIKKLKDQLNEIYVKHTKQPLKYIYESMERDNVRHINSTCTFDSKTKLNFHTFYSNNLYSFLFIF